MIENWTENDSNLHADFVRVASSEVCPHDWIKSSEEEIYCLHCDENYDILIEGEHHGRILT